MFQKSRVDVEKNVSTSLGTAIGYVFAQKLDETPRLAIMSAYEPEWQVLPETIEAEETFQINGFVSRFAGLTNDE
jgi:hypothetical protein